MTDETKEARAVARAVDRFERTGGKFCDRRDDVILAALERWRAARTTPKAIRRKS